MVDAVVEFLGGGRERRRLAGLFVMGYPCPLVVRESRSSAMRLHNHQRSDVRSHSSMRQPLPLHLKPSCNRKNSLNAGSSFNSLSFLGEPCCLSDNAIDFLLFGDCDLGLERHIWASSPSICRSPLRILALSREEMLSKETDSRDSI